MLRKEDYKHWERHDDLHKISIDLAKSAATLEKAHKYTDPASIISTLIKEFRVITDILEQVQKVLTENRKKIRE